MESTLNLPGVLAWGSVWVSVFFFIGAFALLVWAVSLGFGFHFSKQEDYMSKMAALYTNFN